MNTLDSSEISYVLLDGKHVKDRIILRTVSKQLPGSIKVSIHIEALYADASLGRIFSSCKNLECSRLTRSVNPKQRKTLSLFQSEGETLHRTQVCFLVYGIDFT